MTTLSDFMLDVAEQLGNVYEGTATSGSLTYLTDNGITDPTEYYTGGTLWITSGSNSGVIKTVNTHAGVRLNFDAMTSGSVIAASDAFSVMPGQDFKRHHIKQAVNSILKSVKVLLTDETLTVTANTQSYALPAGVSDIRRVEVATTASAPYSYYPNFAWREVNGYLVFDSGKEPTSTGYIIRLSYMGIHGALAETESIKDGISLEWLRWASIEWLWRNYIQRVHKDAPYANELLNEAKNSAEFARLQAKKNQTAMQRDPHHGGW